jgi:hypothetical protein
MSIRPNLEQNSAENSTNFQAGQDIHVHGLTLEEARTVALDVYRSNALELQGIAQAVAVSRAEQLTNEFLNKLEHDLPDQTDKLADPDVQNVLFEAQKEFARSGEDDLKAALVDLLTARTQEDKRNLRTLALNEAIASAPKLTEEQRRAIAWIFYLRYTRDTGSRDPEQFFDQVKGVVNAIGVDLPSGQADYQHIEYVGAGSISMGKVSLGASLLSGDEGLFTNGFDETSVDPALMLRLRENGLVIPAIRNPARVQLALLSEEDLVDILAKSGLDGEMGSINPLMSNGRMTDVEVADEAVARIPEIAPLRTIWDAQQGAIGSMTLTSVGIAIGHAYWSRLTGRAPSLSIWLP